MFNIKKEIRPWGSFSQFALNKKATVRLVCLKKGARIDFETKNDEIFVAIDDGLSFSLNKKRVSFKKNKEVCISKGSTGFVTAKKEDSMFLEVCFGKNPCCKKNFYEYAFNNFCTIKILNVNKGHRLSLQVHQKREENWIVLDDDLKVEIDNKELFPNKRNRMVIPRKAEHRLSAPISKGRVLEVCLGKKFNEGDETRLEDDYNRT